MKNLHPRAVWLFFERLVRSWIALCIISGIIFIRYAIPFVTTSDPSAFSIKVVSFGGIIFVITSIVLLTSCFLWARLQYKNYRYELRDDGFRKEMGVIYKKYVTIPYDRIQNIDIYRGILDRILGLSDLHIQTAGVGIASGEGQLRGLSTEEAEIVRDELVKRSRSGKNSV